MEIRHGGITEATTMTETCDMSSQKNDIRLIHFLSVCNSGYQAKAN
jgi:hypothetical protein